MNARREGRAPLGTGTRIYFHGILGLVVIFAFAYVFRLLVPFFDFVGSPPLAAILTILVLVAAPPIIGSLILFGVYPLLGRKAAWRGLDRWDERLMTEVSDAKQRAQVVLVNWPSEEVRSIGLLTATFKSPDGGELMATVYVPSSPPTKIGYLHVVPLASVEETDWTFREWQLFQLSFGVMTPDRNTDH